MELFAPEQAARITIEDKAAGWVVQEQNGQTKGNAENYLRDDDDWCREVQPWVRSNEIAAPHYAVKAPTRAAVPFDGHCGGKALKR